MGVEKKLLEYAYDRANEDQVPIFADASNKDVSPYLATGFQHIGDVKLRARTVQVPNDAENSDRSKAIALEEIDVPIIMYAPKTTGTDLVLSGSRIFENMQVEEINSAA